MARLVEPALVVELRMLAELIPAESSHELTPADTTLRRTAHADCTGHQLEILRRDLEPLGGERTQTLGKLPCSLAGRRCPS